MLGTNGYKKLRCLGSDVHTFECSKSQNEVIYVQGVKGKLETLADMVKAYPDAIMACNGPFFNFDASSEDCIRWSKYATTVSYTKDSKLLFLYGAKLTQTQRNKYEADARWTAGLGATLVRNGVKDIIKTTAGEPDSRAARTILMRTKDGSFMFAAVQGKMKACAGLKAMATISPFNKGMNAEEAAAFSIYAKAEQSAFCDGGGSSIMIIKINGKWVTVNKPTDGSSRHIGGCFIVLKKNADTLFIEKIAPGAVASFAKDQVLPSITIAQAILESAKGLSKLALECNNLFGIKWTMGCGHEGKLYPTKEYVNGKMITVNAYFRKYDSYAESIADHSQLLQNTRYKPVLASKEYKSACKQIQACGYATDPEYSQLLINTIEKYKLNLFDI